MSNGNQPPVANQVPDYDYTTDPGFLKASAIDQKAYLMATDPDFKNAKPKDQAAYLIHLKGLDKPLKAETPQTDTRGAGERFLSGAWAGTKAMLPAMPSSVGDAFKQTFAMGSLAPAQMAQRMLGEYQQARKEQQPVPSAVAAGAGGMMGLDPSGIRERAAKGDIAGIAGEAAPSIATTLIGGEVAKTKPRVQSFVKSLIGATPERLEELGQVEGNLAKAHQAVTKAEADAHQKASAAYPDIKTPVKYGTRQVEVPAAPSLDPTAPIGKRMETVTDEIPFREAQEKYSDLGKRIAEVKRARARGLATGFDLEPLVKQQAELGEAMKAAATTDGVAALKKFLKAKKGFKAYMDDFHNQGSPVQSLLQMKPDETSKIANHFLNADKGARSLEVLKKYGVDISKIQELMKGGGRDLKVDVNEAAKLRKMGDQYPEMRLNESINQAKYNTLQSEAQAKLPAWAMRERTKLPIVPDFMKLDIPTRAIIKNLLESGWAREAVTPKKP